MSSSMTARVRLAAKHLATYVLLSSALFAGDTVVYVVYFSLTKPKYTFLTGNKLIIVLAVLEILGVFGWTFLRKGHEPDEARFRTWSSFVVTGLLLLYGLHATVLTIVERSVSINVMRFLHRQGTEPYAAIEKNFVETFVLRDKAVCKRLDEQVRLGNVAFESGRYMLTPKGERTFGILDTATLITAADRPENAPQCP